MQISTKRNRYYYSFFILFTVTLGLASRKLGSALPGFVVAYVGDVLWALMAFLIFGFIFPRKSSGSIALMAVACSFSVEFSQLSDAVWLVSLRKTTVGALILGRGFLWSDLVCYLVGITVGYLLETNRYRKNEVKFRESP